MTVIKKSTFNNLSNATKYPASLFKIPKGQILGVTSSHKNVAVTADKFQVIALNKCFLFELIFFSYLFNII